jgi:hypothetical protein
MNRLVVHVDQLTGKVLGTLDIVIDGLSQIREMQSWSHVNQVRKDNCVNENSLLIEPATTEYCNSKWGIDT